MSIAKLQEPMLHTPLMDELTRKHQNNYKKTENLLSLQHFLADLLEGEIVCADIDQMNLYYSSGEYIPSSGEELLNIYELFPSMRRKIEASKDDLTSIVKDLTRMTEERISKAKHYTEMLSVRSKKELWRILSSNNISAMEKDVLNLTTLLTTNPLQEIRVTLKRTLELSNVQDEKEEPTNDTPFHVHLAESTGKERDGDSEREINYYRCGIPKVHHTMIESRLPAFATCSVFYYEENYYDYVNSQIMLMEIADGKINYSTGIEVVNMHDMLSEGSRLPRPPPEHRRDLDQYFVFRHPGKGRQCIGGIKYNTKENHGITAKLSPDLYIRNNDERLRYGTKYINRYNTLYRHASMEDNGDVRKDLVARDTADGLFLHYGMIPYEERENRLRE